MIEDPVALTIRRTVTRPAASLVAAFADAQTSFISDAMNGKGALDRSIKPLDPASRFVGTAITAAAGPRDNLAACAMLDYVEPGDVVVIATGRDESGAVIGDHYATLAKKLGVRAIVTDGLARDAAGCRQVGLPVFARGVAPNSAFRNGPGDVNLAISIGGVTVEPGDLVVGDGDGVIVVPRDQVAAVQARLEAVKRLEIEAEETIASGAKQRLWDPVAIEARGIRYVD